jgi:uncharacterized protein with HEPN domain
MKPGEGADPATLRDMLEACSDIVAFTQDLSREQFLDNRPRKFAAAFRVAVLGEAVKRLSAEFRSRYPEIPWHRIAGMRDRLIHGYDNIDYDEVWKTASIDVPALLEQLRKIRTASES